MSSNAIVQFSPAELALAGGDLSKLSPEQRGAYYLQVCDSIGVNPLTQPFQYIVLNGKLTLYATRVCTDQLRATRKVGVSIVSRERMDNLYVVTARATSADGRADESIGVVNLEGLKGDALANALMKTETKAKRRVTLSFCGLGWLDESEVETIPGAQVIPIEPPAITAGNGHAPTHWIEDKTQRARFWATVKEMGVTEEEARAALGVTSLKEYGGTFDDAMAEINTFANQKADAQAAKEGAQ